MPIGAIHTARGQSARLDRRFLAGEEFAPSGTSAFMHNLEYVRFSFFMPVIEYGAESYLRVQRKWSQARARVD